LRVLLLALVLGQLGAHRFYLRKTGTALVMLALTILGYGLVIHVNSVPRAVRPYPDGHLESVQELGLAIFSMLGIVWVWTVVDIITAARGRFRDTSGEQVRL
jgi:hypothetical protein